MTHLEPNDRINPLWLALEKHFEERLVMLRARNDNPEISEIETAALRGRIAEVKAILGMGKERPQE
jgi:hypothetical protein